MYSKYKDIVVVVVVVVVVPWAFHGKPRMYCSLLAYCTAPTDAFRTPAAEV
jgi:hypothetical protein